MIKTKMTREELDLLRESMRGDLDSLLAERSDLVKKDGEYVLAGEFYEKQTRIALRNFNIIDPESLDEYIARDGYLALEKAIFENSPADIITEMKAANLRGRGGAGFPAGRKWETAAREDSYIKYMICNADEGDPGAYMDRSIMEGDPHSVLEGMAIGGYAVGSEQGFIYIRAEYPRAVEMLEHAIAEAEERGLLGDNILGSDFSFHIELRLGSGAFVCGEATALMESIEGKRGMPRPKIYRTSVRGLWDKPTIVNNVETYANVPQIIRKGADWFTSTGTEDSPGTKVFALVGKVVNSGLVEVPMGTTIDEIVFDIGGGLPDGHTAKAVQTGGPSGGCIPAELFDTRVDFGSLAEIGSIMGSGGMVVLDESDCMGDIARFFLEFTVDESCGICTPCREGTKRMLEMIERITEGKAEYEDLDRITSLADTISSTSLCGLGQTASTPVVSTMHYFFDEYQAHVVDKKCPALHCKELISFFIESTCIGCLRCKRECPVSCISGDVKERHIIDQTACIKCGNCFDVCPVSAITKS